MTTVLEAIEEEERASRIIYCKTCTWLSSRDPEERAQWERALADKTRETSPILRAMTRFGFEGGHAALSNHRRSHGR